MKYPGFSIKYSAMPQDFGYIVERVQSRLARWKATLLSFVGRLVLTQALTTTIPNYAMQCVTLPTKILNSVDRLSCNFLWGSIESKKKIHLVNWKKIAKPKRDGGLGIQAAKVKNIANLAKLNWCLQFGPSSLWAKVLYHKYRTPRRAFSPRPFSRTCSTTWAAIQKCEAIFKKGSKWIVGKDSQLSFWYDKWLDRGPFRGLIAGPLNRGEEATTLKKVTSFSGWDW